MAPKAAPQAREAEPAPSNDEEKDMTPAEKQRAAMERLAEEQALQKAKLEAEKAEQKLCSVENMQQLARQGDLPRLNKALETKGLKHDNPWCQRGMVMATSEGNIPVVERLLEVWDDLANAKDPDSNKSALCGACSRGHTEVVRILCAAKADVNSAAAGGTPLDAALAAKPQQPVILLELLRNGANVSDENKRIPGMKKALDEMAHEDKVNDIRRSLFEVVNKGPSAPAKQKLEAAEHAARKEMRRAQEFMSEVEEHKEGEILMALDRTLLEERSSASKSLRLESEEHTELEALTAQLRTRRDEIEGLDDLLRRQRGDHDRLHEEHRDLEYSFQLRAEQHSELHEAHESGLGSKLEKEEAKQLLDERTKALQSEMDLQKRHGIEVSRELQFAKEELQAWREDQDRAATLTQQAHDRLLDRSDRSPLPK